MPHHSPEFRARRPNKPLSRFHYHKSLSKSFKYDSYQPHFDSPLEIVDQKTDMASPIRFSTAISPTSAALLHQDPGGIVNQKSSKSYIKASELLPSPSKADSALTVLDLSDVDGPTRDSVNNSVSLFRHVQKCQDEIGRLEKENHETQSKLEVLRSENQSIHETLRSSEAARETLRATAEKDRIEIKKLKTGWDRLEVRCVDLQGDVQAQREDRIKAVNKHNDLLKEHEKLKIQHNNLTIRFANFKTEAAKLEADLKSTDSGWKTTQSQMIDLTTQLSISKEMLTKYIRENDSLRSLLTEAHTELRNLIHHNRTESHGSVETFARHLHQLAIDFAKDAQASNKAIIQGIAKVLTSKTTEMQALGIARSPSPRKSLHDIENDDVVVVSPDDCRPFLEVTGCLPTPATTPLPTPPAKLKLLKRKSPEKEESAGGQERESDDEPLASKRRKRKDVYDVQ